MLISSASSASATLHFFRVSDFAPEKDVRVLTRAHTESVNTILAPRLADQPETLLDLMIFNPGACIAPATENEEGYLDAMQESAGSAWTRQPPHLARPTSYVAGPSEWGATFNFPSPAQMQVNSEDMEVDSDAQSADSIQIITESANDADTARVKSIYHQGSVTVDDPSSYTWNLPAVPLAYKPAKLKCSQEHAIVIAYARTCGLIGRNWKVSPQDCLPVDLRARTPYSLVLLNALRRLSSATKGDLQRAQSLLHDACNHCMLGSDITSYGMVRLIETQSTGAEHKRFGPNCEVRITENVFGLTIEDVNRAIASLNQARAEEQRTNQTQLKTPARIGRQQKRLARRERRNQALQLSTVQGAPSISKIERGLKRRKRRQPAESTANRAFSFGDELVDIEFGSSGQNTQFAVPPNSPVATFDQASRSAIDTDLREVGNRHNEQAGSMNRNEDTLPQPSKYDREQDKHMSRFLGSMNMDSATTLKRKRLRKLQAGGLSRGNSESVPMPSEKINLGSLPALHSMSSTVAQDELSRIGQRPLPELSQLSIGSAAMDSIT